tara:strand:+ start:134 stop:658 length:525 start_codon:yes stop_codon:yes gene_type:complete
MILSCNSCAKKFVVPDQAITSDGRLVQCGSCGNKWRQYPIKTVIEQTQSISNTKKTSPKPIQIQQKINKPKKIKKSKPRKPREIGLYSPEYLEKKHGIKLDHEIEKNITNRKVSFGFYNSLLLLSIIIIILSRSLYFFQDFVVQKFPFTEFYINYFFESIRNIFTIWKNLISNY